MTEHRLDVPHEHHPCWVREGGEERGGEVRGRGEERRADEKEGKRRGREGRG